MLFSILLVIVIVGVQSDKIPGDIESIKKQDAINLTASNENVITTGNDQEENFIPVHNQNVYEIAKTLVSLLKTEGNEKRMNELKDKLDKIDKYVVDKNQFAAYLKNITTESSLNATMFYKSLKEDDHLKFLKEKEAKNLYLKLKENMNRDDIIKVIATRGNRRKIVKYARRMMQEDMAYNNKNSKDIINAVVDKILGEKPSDNHKYTQNESIYWDPQKELEDLQEYHKHSVDGRRLFKGERTTVRRYPFMVSVHVTGRFWCGGVIYWHDLIMTSASCLQLMHNNRFYRENPKVLVIRVGSNHSRIGGEEIEANEVYFHPGYNPRNLRNNIAIIRIRRHLYFSYHHIPKCIPISKYPHGVPATAEVLLLGWGVTKMSQKLSYEPIYLQQKILPVYPNTFCKEIYGDKFITTTMFCAGTMTTGEGACDHDAGGPALLNGKLVGIISFGPSICGFPNAPTVFTLVGAYSEWIESVNESMPSYYRGKKYTTTTTRHMVFSYLQTLLHLHTSSTMPPTLTTLPTVTTPPTVTTTLPDLLRIDKDSSSLARDIFDDDDNDDLRPRQRIPPPVFKLTKKKIKNSRKEKKWPRKQPQVEEDDFDLGLSSSV